MSQAAQHQLGLLFFLCVQLLIALSNWRALHRLDQYPSTEIRPLVSVLIPARNEAAVISGCLESLLAQDYSNLEFLILNDQSTDDTGAIIAQFAVQDERLHCLQGSDLPEGWLGKPWACSQLAGAAKGDLLLFMDADVRLHPRCLTDAVSALLWEDADLISVLPREFTGTWGERLTVPMMAWSIYSLLPLTLAHRVQWAPLSASVGQFMLYRREKYQAAGGHKAVRATSAEDVALTHRLIARGGRWRLVDGRERVFCRMYTGFRQSFRGLSKSLFAAFGHNLVAILFAWLWIGIVYLESPIVLALSGLGLPPDGFSSGLAAAGVGLAALIWLIFAWRLAYPRLLAVLYPIPIALALGIAFHSVYAGLTGKATWKDRSIPHPDHPRK